MFNIRWTAIAREQYNALKDKADAAYKNRRTREGQGGKKPGKSTKDEGLFKQVGKTLQFLQTNPRHPGLNTHEYASIPHPWNKQEKVFEAYVQNQTPGAYRVFWCYGPDKGDLTILAITPHP